MSGYLSHLVNRTLNLSPQVRPAVGTRFAPGPELLTDRAELPPDLRESAPAAAVQDRAASRRPHVHADSQRPAQPAAGETATSAPAAERLADPPPATRNEAAPAQRLPEPLPPPPEPLRQEQQPLLSTPPRRESEPQLIESEYQFDEYKAQYVEKERQFTPREAHALTALPPTQEAAPAAPELTAIQARERADTVPAAATMPVGQGARPVASGAPIAGDQQPPAAAAPAQAQQAATFLQRVQRTLSAMNAEAPAPAPEPTAQPAARLHSQVPGELHAQAQVQAQVRASEKPQAQEQVRGREQERKSSEPPIIRVHIDHIEVRAPAASVPVVAAAPAASAQGVSLSQYLEQRRRRS